MFYPFREKGTTKGTTIFLYFAISELQFGALLRSLTKIFLGDWGIASFAMMVRLQVLSPP
jgi:hypothetical protein